MSAIAHTRAHGGQSRKNTPRSLLNRVIASLSTTTASPSCVCVQSARGKNARSGNNRGNRARRMRQRRLYKYVTVCRTSRVIAHGGEVRSSIAIVARRKSPRRSIDSRNRFETEGSVAKNESSKRTKERIRSKLGNKRRIEIIHNNIFIIM